LQEKELEVFFEQWSNIVAKGEKKKKDTALSSKDN